MTTPLILLRDIAKSFGATQAVRGLSLEVEAGEVLGLLGPNGAGKSTSLRIASGCLDPTSGSAHIAGFDLSESRLAAQARLGYLPEGAPCWEAMSPNDLFIFLGRARGLDKQHLRARSEAVVELAGLEAVRRRPFDSLSKGFRRRVALAAALLHDPPALILDEPTDGLDPNQKRGLRARIRELAEDKAIIVSTHILEEVPALCDRIVVIDHGRTVFTGTPAGFVEGHADLDAAFAAVTASEVQP